MVDSGWGRWSVPLLLAFAVAAGAGDTPVLELTTAEEPGDRLQVEVTLSNSGAPVPPGEWTVYQTDAEGYYRKSEAGRDLGGSQARIRGSVRLETSNGFRIETIRPAPYPGGGVPAHLHLQGRLDDGRKIEQTVRVSGPESRSVSVSARTTTCWLEEVPEDGFACSIEIELNER